MQLRQGDELFREIDNHAAGLIHEVQVRMQSNLIGTNQAKEIDSHVLRQLLQFRGCDLFAGKHHDNEYGRIVAPVKTDMIFDSA
jgi:hypothetical protein